MIHSLFIKRIQEGAFEEDYQHLKHDKEVRKGSKLAQLNLFIDESGVIRLRGRLENSELPENMKTPILLQQRHRLKKLIIEDAHRNTGHSGVKHVMSNLRERY